MKMVQRLIQKSTRERSRNNIAFIAKRSSIGGGAGARHKYSDLRLVGQCERMGHHYLGNIKLCCAWDNSPPRIRLGEMSVLKDFVLMLCSDEKESRIPRSCCCMARVHDARHYVK